MIAPPGGLAVREPGYLTFKETEKPGEIFLEPVVAPSEASEPHKNRCHTPNHHPDTA